MGLGQQPPPPQGRPGAKHGYFPHSEVYPLKEGVKPGLPDLPAQKNLPLNGADLFLGGFTVGGFFPYRTFDTAFQLRFLSPKCGCR